MKKIIPSLFVLILFGCGENERPLQHVSPEVRVLLGEGKNLEIRPYKNYIFSIHSRKEMGDGPVILSLSNDMIEINGTLTLADTIEILPSDYCEFQGKKYRGNLRIVIQNDKLLVINILDIESYLYGVLPNEVSPDWDMQALKAQAVVSRTFALFEIASSRKSARPYDIYDDTRSQVYNGLEEETKMSSLAVDSTIGEVVRYNGKIIQSFFHSASGGMTESAKEAFGDDKPYLTAVNSPYSQSYKDNRWEFTIPMNQFVQAAHIQGTVSGITVTERTPSKRIKTVEVVDSLSKKTFISGKDFRNLVGPTAMKSTRANIRVTNDSIWIGGVGYGHGVGLGQWDALGMAKQGIRYHDILTFFYKGTTIDRIW